MNESWAEWDQLVLYTLNSAIIQLFTNITTVFKPPVGKFWARRN